MVARAVLVVAQGAAKAAPVANKPGRQWQDEGA